MKLYAIHAPRAAEAVAGPEGANAARQGFSVAALVFGPLWLLFCGAWWALLGYFVAAAAGVALTWLDVIRPGAGAGLMVLAHLYLGFEGRTLAQRARERAGRPLVDVIYAHSAFEAEKIHLERALSAAHTQARRAAPMAAPEVIGLFPEPGR